MEKQNYELFEKLKRAGKIKDVSEAFKEFPPEEEWHKGDASNFFLEEAEKYGEYEIGDIVFVKEYKWNNRDSVIYKYPADKIYNGVIIDKERTSRYVGVPGKGGHPDVDYYVTIKFNNQIFKTDDYHFGNVSKFSQ